MIILASLVFPKYAYYKEARCADYLDYIWVNLQVNITLFVDADKIVFGGVTDDGCVACKSNKIMD